MCGCSLLRIEKHFTFKPGIHQKEYIKAQRASIISTKIFVLFQYLCNNPYTLIHAELIITIETDYFKHYRILRFADSIVDPIV